MTLVGEIDKNHDSFLSDWTKQSHLNWNEISKNKALVLSYRRICAFSAIRSQIIEHIVSAEVHAFALEAHNDAIVAHILASTGAWRASLQSLRSFVENALNCAYYMDHPIECRLWSKGGNRLTFSDLHTYFSKHPDLVNYPISSTGIEQLKSEYSELSKAVHGSARSFRMTEGTKGILLWSTDKKDVGMWSARETKAHESICLIYAYLFSDKLNGTKLPSVRSALNLAISKKKATELKKHVGISIR